MIANGYPPWKIALALDVLTFRRSVSRVYSKTLGKVCVPKVLISDGVTVKTCKARVWLAAPTGIAIADGSTKRAARKTVRRTGKIDRLL